MIGRFTARPEPTNFAPEILALRREVELLRELVEARAASQPNLVRELVEQQTPRVAEALERRIRHAGAEAMAFADQGLQQHEAALRALGRRVAELSRAPTPPEPPALAAPAEAGAYLIGVASSQTRDCRRLDIREDSEAGFLADLANLPILPGGAARLVAAHVVEYAPAAALAGAILPHWRSRLAPGGELVIVTLDGPAWAADLARADFATLRRRLGADGAGRPPRHLFDAAGLSEILAQAGLLVEAPAHAPDFTLRIAAKAPAP